MIRTIAIAVCVGFGVLVFTLTFVTHPFGKALYSRLLDFWQIIFACGIVVGATVFVFARAKEMARKERIGDNALLLAGAIGMPALALVGGLGPGSPFHWTFANIQAPLQSTVFALLAFFLTSAAFRGFRARNLASVTLLITALIVILGRIPSVELAIPDSADFINWIREIPSTAGRRAILIGIGLGSVATSLRVIFGLDRAYLGGK